jgi:type III secretion inner rod protein HrpB2
MNQPLHMIDVSTTVDPAQDVAKTMPSPEAIGKFQALMQQASAEAPTAGPSDDVTALSKIVGARDVQMEELFDHVEAMQHYGGQLSLHELVTETNLMMDKMARFQADTTIMTSFLTSTKGSVESLMKNQ